MTIAKIYARLREEPAGWLRFLITHWPETPSGSLLRRWYWNRRLGFPHDCGYGRAVVFDYPALIHIGNRCDFSSETQFFASESAGIFIGDEVIMGPQCYLRAGNHNIGRLDIPLRDQGHSHKSLPYLGQTYSIVVENNVWLGARVVLLSGAWIGTGTVVSAGSIIKDRIPPNSVVGKCGVYPRRANPPATPVAAQAASLL